MKKYNTLSLQQRNRVVTNSQRIIVNTAAQYTRTIINVCLSLYSTRLILTALGQSDYGIYSVVAGVVAMLSFITNALVTTTQRYLSFHHGAGDKDKIRLVFGNSVLLHILIGVALTIILCAIGPWVINHLLNIAQERLEAALIVYFATVVMLLLTFLTAPVRALFIARENIVYISIIDVLDGVLKLCLAIWLSHITYDRLITYAGFMTSIQLFNLFAFIIFAAWKFEECHWPSLHEWNKQYIRELSGFAGWTIYSTGCIIARTQGVAILLNRFLGTTINAAYGIALQVTGAIQFVSASILNAINPQIMKAEGCGDRQRMIMLAEYASKYAFLLLSMVAIPLIAEMDTILHLWLGDVPEYATMFCQFILVAALCDQLTIGLTSANQAIGQIGNYSLIFYSIKLLTLVGAWICLRKQLPIESVMWCYVIIEFLSALIRLPLLYKMADISILHFCKHVLGRTIIPLVSMVLVAFAITMSITNTYRFFLTIITTLVVGGITIWFTALEKAEKQLVLNYIHHK